MKSPFAIFRKNQRVGMALLTIMAMFAFVFLGNAGSRGGGRSGGGSEVVASTNVGKIDVVMLQDMIRNRNMCNQFLQRAIVRALPDSNQYELQRLLQDYTFGPATRQNMVLHFLLRQEAHRLGIIVSDTAVEQAIDRATQGKLSTSAFNELLSEMRWNSRDLYDALRAELESKMAFDIGVPRDLQTPDQYWSFHRQLKVEASVQVAALPVKEFLSKVPDPTDKELKEYFDANKNRWPGLPPDYKPGFKQPRRVQTQYLTASYEAVEGLVPEVTDEDVQKYYDEHKDVEFVETSAPKRSNEAGPIEPEFTPENPDAAPKDGDSAKPGEEKPGEEKPAGEKSEAPAQEKPADTEKKPVEPKEDQPESSPKDEKAAPQEKKSEDEPRGARIGAPKATELLAFAEDAEQAAKAQDPQPTATDAAPAEAKPAPTEKSDKPADDKPEAADKPAEAKPEAAGEKADQPEAPAGKPGATEDPAPATGAESEEKPKEKKYRPLTDELKQVIHTRILDQRTQAALGELADHASEAMTQLSLKYNNLAMKSTRGGWELYADLDGNNQLDEGEPSIFLKQKPNLESLDPTQYRLLRAAVAKVAAVDLEREAKKLQMGFGETHLVSAMQLRDLPQIGNAEELTEDAMSLRSSASIEQMVFGDQTLYRALRLRNPDTRNLIVAWKTQDVPARIPAFTEADVKEEVLNTWKTQHAQPLAEKRAEELAKLVNEHEGDSASKSLHDQTVNGDKDGTTVTVSSPPEFTWMRESTAPSQNPFAKPPPQLSQITFVDRPGTQFMRVVFDELKEGQAGVAPNEDRSIYYVVKLVRRNPGTKEGLAAMRETFLKTNLFPIQLPPPFPSIPTPYSYLAQQQQREAFFEWQRNLEKRYALEWMNPSDEIGDSE